MSNDKKSGLVVEFYLSSHSDIGVGICAKKLNTDKKLIFKKFI